MPLDTATKTVLLHDGPFDESDRFLLRTPATDYIENQHFHQRGSLQKRAGNELLGTVPSATDTPIALHAIGDSLHVLTQEGARAWNGTSWAETNVTGFLGTKEMVLEAPPVGGMGHIDLFLEYDAPVGQGGTLIRYVLCFEVREESSSDALNGEFIARPKHVVLQTYSPSGKFLTQFRVDNAQSPKLTRSASTQEPVLWYQQVSNENLWFGVVNADGQVVFADSTIRPSSKFGQESHGIKSNVYGPMFVTRLGASADGMGRYHVAVDEINEKYLVFYRRKRIVGTNGLWMARFSVLGGLENSENLYADASNLTHEALDILYDRGNCYLLRGLYISGSQSPADRLSQVWVEKRETTGSFTKLWDEPVRSDLDVGNSDFYGRTYSHGGLTSAGGFGNVAWFVHDAGEAVVTDLSHVRDQNTGIHWGVLSSGGSAIGDDRFLPHHRLASRPTYYNGSLYCAVQQWTDMTPFTRSVQLYLNDSSTIGALIPRTTVVACFDQTNNVVRPVAYLDAGKSKTQEYGESEWSVHSPHIWIDDRELVVPNRVAVYNEDLSLHLTAAPAIGFLDPPLGARTGAQESASDALCRVHRISRGTAKANASNLGDGLALSTAVPLWFDGKFFGEFGPLDAPEIINVLDSRMSTSSPPLRPLLAFDASDSERQTVNQWTKLQVVVGYYDSRGNKHRSAPSTTVYVCDLSGADPDGIPATVFPENWRGKSVQVYFTCPLSVLPADLEYFAELYGCPADENNLVLIDATTIDLSTTPQPEDLCINATLVRWQGGVANAQFNRPQRASRSIYTQGGELAATPWPAFTHSVVTSTRFWALDAINKGKVLPSKKFEDFIAPEYNALLDINLGDERDLLAIGKVDDKVVVFEKDDIHVIYGDGPENNGAGEDFAVHYISTDVGCQNQNSLVECPAGLVFFREERGFYLLDRQLNIRFIGDRVYNLTKGISVVSAELVSADGHVRFLCSVTGTQQDVDGEEPTNGYTRPPRPIYGNKAPDSDFALVWNYEKDQWTVFSNYPGVASTIYQGAYTRLLDDWTIWTERAVTDWQYQDPTGTNRTLTRTPWIPLADNTQGYSRCYRMNVLGRYLSSLATLPSGAIDACDIQVKVWYDYEEGPGVTPQTKVFSYRDFGFDPFSTDRNIRAERLQFTVTPAEGRGRCQAVKLEFEEILPTPWNGESYELGQGFEISSIDFEIGVDPRVTRQLPAAVRK